MVYDQIQFPISDFKKNFLESKRLQYKVFKYNQIKFSAILGDTLFHFKYLFYTIEVTGVKIYFLYLIVRLILTCSNIRKIKSL